MAPSSPEEVGRPTVVVLATRNAGKVRELRALLADLPIHVHTLDDHPEVPVLEETGATFEANAAAKALTVAQRTGHLALADDSGLEVDALDGAPGVHSATFLGPEATDADRSAWVLDRLRGLETDRRTARYRAVIAVAGPEGTVRMFEGRCEGRITERPVGEGGFGYDPIFLVPELGHTMAELPPEVKNEISHRARALEAARSYLAALLSGRPSHG